MWRVTGLVNGVRRELDSRMVEREEPPSLEQVREAAAELPRAERLIRYLDAERRITQENQRFVRSFDAVQRWSARAAADSLDYAGVRDRFVSIPDAEGALGYFSSPPSQPPGHPDSVVWHAHTIVVVSVLEGATQIDLEYMPERRDAVRLEWLTARFQTPAHAVETILDARTCRGTDSQLIDYFRTMRAGGNGFFASIRGTADMLVGRILHRVSRSEPAPLKDLTYQPRLDAMQGEWRDLARSCPDIASVSSAHNHDTAMVFIHGTLSCGLQSLKDLFPGALPTFPVYRYEHDTFLRVSANGQQLARLIVAYINAKHLLLVAHSRGGLVGRVTLQALQGGFTGDTQLLTFGTPHGGTPLVRVAKGVLNLLLKVGSQIVDGIPLMVPIVAAASHAYNISSLPDGIAIMEPGSEPLDQLNDRPWLPQVRCWGSAFDPVKGESGFGFDIQHVLAGAMGDEPHDLVVPMRSALAYGTRQPALSCSHVRYFAQPAVKAAIMDALPPEVPVPPNVPEGRIHDAATHVTAERVRVMKALTYRPHLEVGSRLPRWFALPEGARRLDVQVFLDYATGGSVAVMTLQLAGSVDVLQSITCEVHSDSKDSVPGEYPKREILSAGPLVETIEYHASGFVFHMVDDADLVE